MVAACRLHGTQRPAPGTRPKPWNRNVLMRKVNSTPCWRVMTCTPFCSLSFPWQSRFFVSGFYLTNTGPHLVIYLANPGPSFGTGV